MPRNSSGTMSEVEIAPPAAPASLARRAASAIGDVFVDAWSAAPLVVAAVVVVGGAAGYRIAKSAVVPPICTEPEKPARWDADHVDGARWGG